MTLRGGQEEGGGVHVQYGSILASGIDETQELLEEDVAFSSQRGGVRAVIRRYQSVAIGSVCLVVAIFLMAAWHRAAATGEAPTDWYYEGTSDASAELLGSPGRYRRHHSRPTNRLLDPAMDSTELMYDDQLVDHLNRSSTRSSKEANTYSQRYYKIGKHFKGPGSPILVIMGGEESLDLPLLYPFVHEGLAKLFGAFVLSPEHRYVRGSSSI